MLGPLLLALEESFLDALCALPEGDMRTLAGWTTTLTLAGGLVVNGTLCALSAPGWLLGWALLGVAVSLVSVFRAVLTGRNVFTDAWGHLCLMRRIEIARRRQLLFGV